jgi:hypothetical protein
MRRSSCLVLLSLLLCGCGAAEHTGNPVSGTVTFQGKPLDQGSIRFSPVGGQGTMSGGPIKNGEYLLPATSGLEPGKYEVRITSSDAGHSSADEMPGEVKEAPKERIPPEYNARTKLFAEIQSSGENKFDFAIP